MPAIVCCVYDCTSQGGKGRQLHAFPKNQEMRKAWIRFVNSPNIPHNMPPCNIRPHHKVCQKHFLRGDYLDRSIRANQSDAPERKRLKDTAVPTVKKPSVKTGHGTSKSSVTDGRTIDNTKEISEEGSEVAYLQKCNPSNAGKEKDGDNSFLMRQNEEEIDMGTILLSSTPKSSTKRRPTPFQRPTIDLDYSVPSDTTETTFDETFTAEEQFKDEKCMVYLKELLQLFKLCHTCGRSLIDQPPPKVCYMGSSLRIKWICPEGHLGSWDSMPVLRGMPEGNLMLVTATLLTGATYSDIADWAKQMRLNFLSYSQFKKIQAVYVLPCIDLFFQSYQDNLRTTFMSQELDLNGDGRSDSPGFSAKFTSYTLMEEHTKKILNTQLVQVSETTSSVAMEVVGLSRALDALLDYGINVRCLTTDRAPSVRTIMRDQYPDIRHEYDPWHVIKGFMRKLTTLTNRRKVFLCLRPWLKSINNHFWWACSSCEGDAEELYLRWTSVLCHVSNRHTWTEKGEIRSCYHEPYTEEKSRKTMWLNRKSEAFCELEKLVKSSGLLRDLKKMTEFHHTGDLEAFHNCLLKYAPKRIHFPYSSMKGRIQLAVLDHNHNTGRPQAEGPSGPRYKFVYSKRSGCWVVKKLFEGKSYEFRDQLTQMIFERRVDSTVRLNYDEATQYPFLSKNIAPTPRPPKNELIEKHRSRFSDKLL